MSDFEYQMTSRAKDRYWLLSNICGLFFHILFSIANSVGAREHPLAEGWRMPQAHWMEIIHGSFQGGAQPLYGQARHTGGVTAQKSPSTMAGWDLGGKYLFPHLSVTHHYLPEGPHWNWAPLFSVVKSPAGISWDHLPNNVLAPKSMFLTLVGTQTKWFPKHSKDQSCLQTDSQKA